MSAATKLEVLAACADLLRGWCLELSDAERLQEAVIALYADSERLDWLEVREGTNLISDDGGRWSAIGSGFQPVPEKDGFTESVAITSFVEPEEWHTSVRAAIDAAIREEQEPA